MRLLPKSEIDKIRVAEKRREADEGLKLARRVDNLREIAASEEASLEKFRRETVEKINNEISLETKKRDSLVRENDVLAEKRRKALEPLKKEWAAVVSEKGILKDREAAVAADERIINRRQIEIQNTLDEANIILERARTKNELSITGLQEAEKDRKEAKILLIAARKVDTATTERQKRIDGELIHRESLVVRREEAATMVEKEISAREKELADGWILLRDQEAMLARDIKRLDKK